MTDTTPDQRVAETAIDAARIMALIEDRLQVEVPSAHTPLYESGLIDSLGLVDLLVGLKEEFGVEVDVTTMDMDDLGTADAIAALVRRHMTRESDR